MSWYNPDMLVGFNEEERLCSARTPHLSDETVSRMARHVQRNIDAVDGLYAERAR